MTDPTSPHCEAESCAWPHRWAVFLVCATFPLIWVGGLVTTYDAGMAVPDWPSTFGYNLFLYPWQTWIAGPWDLFIEHGHRLLGSVVGFITIGLMWAVWRRDGRRWMRGLAVAALVLVVIQGVLGGQRVLLDDRRIAQIHGCVGPLFFSFAAAITVFTSNWWRRVSTFDAPKFSRRIVVGCWLVFGLAVLQLLLGSQLRHGIEYATPRAFQTAVLFHVIGAFLLVAQSLWSAFQIRKTHASQRLKWPAWGLCLLAVAQVLLGVGTWAVKYGWPTILAKFAISPGFVVQAEGMGQAVTVTAHVAIGSLILAVSGLLVARSSRLAYLFGEGRRHLLETNSVHVRGGGVWLTLFGGKNNDPSATSDAEKNVPDPLELPTMVTTPEPLPNSVRVAGVSG